MAIFRKRAVKRTIVVKRPAAQHEGRPSIAILPEDVLAMVVNVLADAFVQSLPKLACVNTMFYSLARAGLQKRIVFNLDTAEQTSTSQHCAYLQAEDLYSVVQDITIVDWSISGYAGFQSEDTITRRLQDLRQICALIPQLPALRWIRYEGQLIPATVLQSTEGRPGIKLVGSIQHDGATTGTMDLTATTNLNAFLGNTQLYDLTVTILYYASEDCKENMVLLRQVLLACKGIRKLHLNVTPGGAGCTAGQFSVGRMYAGMGFLPGETWPPLEELVLEDYPFGAEPHPPGSQSFNTVGYPARGQEIDLWVENFDWSYLRKLHTPFAQLVCKLTPQLMALRDFGCEPRGRSRARWGPDGDLADFLLNVPTELHKISLSTLSPPELQGVIRHGNSLQRLKVHMPEREHRSWVETSMDLSALSQIRTSCPKLMDLTVDLYRNESWPDDVLDLLSSYTSLQTMELCFELGVNSKHQPIRPFVTYAAAENLFERIRGIISGGQAKLHQLVIRSDSSPMFQGGFPSPTAFWNTHNSCAILCRLADKDEDAKAGRCIMKQVGRTSRPEQEVVEREMAQFHSSCSNQSSTFSKRLQSAAHSLRTGKRVQRKKGGIPPRQTSSESKMDGAWRVASHGPVPIDQWNALY